MSFSLSGDVTESKPEWMISLEHSVERWLVNDCPAGNAMKKLKGGKEAAQLVLNPLYRSMQREYNIFRKLLGNVVPDLTLVKKALSNEIDINNKIRALFVDLRVEGMPPHWKVYGGCRVNGQTTSLWLPDFTKRVAMFNKLASVKPDTYGNIDIWLGGFISPEAFVAASKQAVARDLKCSLEELTLKVTVDDKTKKKNCFTFKSLHLFGAGWEGDKLCIDDSIMFKLPLTRFTWITKKEAKKDKDLYLPSPVYLDESREKFLFEVELKVPTHIPIEVWSKRGVCICVW